MAWFGATLWFVPACGDGETGIILGRQPPTLSDGGMSDGTIGDGGDASDAAPDVAPPDADLDADVGAPDSGVPPWVLSECTPTVIFENRDTSSKGQLFTDAVPDPEALVHGITHNVCRILYRDGSEVKPNPTLTLIVEDFGGVATASGDQVRLSSNHLQLMHNQGADLAAEIEGVLHFSVTNLYQHDAEGTAPWWVVSGTADFVRYSAGFLDPSERQPGGSWDDGFKTTAFFFAWIVETRDGDFVHALNQRLAPEEEDWVDSAFTDVAGGEVITLWDEYQASFP